MNVDFDDDFRAVQNLLYLLEQFKLKSLWSEFDDSDIVVPFIERMRAL
jgi:hypothetical protein